MKKVLSALLVLVMVFSIAYALPANTAVMPRTGFYSGSVIVSSGKTWTSDRYEIPGAYDNIYLEADLIEGSGVTVELYGANALSTHGVKVGSFVTGTGKHLSVKRNYSYYFVKVVNNSNSTSTSFVMLYA